MRRHWAPLMLTAMIVTGCSDGGTPEKASVGKRRDGGKMTDADLKLRQYIDSEKGRRDRDASIAKAQKGTMAGFGERVRNAGTLAFEGVWISEQGKVGGYRLQVSMGRDGVVFMELVDANGASRQYAQGSLTIKGMTAKGTLRNAGGALKPFSTWTMARRRDGIQLSGSGISVFITRKDVSRT